MFHEISFLSSGAVLSPDIINVASSSSLSSTLTAESDALMILFDSWHFVNPSITDDVGFCVSSARPLLLAVVLSSLVWESTSLSILFLFLTTLCFTFFQKLLTNFEQKLLNQNISKQK